MGNVEPFEQAAPVRRADDGGLVLDLQGYEGPIDVLLALARQQKVDLTRISILELADQYLAFIAEARRLRLEIAADYLVMAAWLAYLKSRLLLPAVAGDEEPAGPELAAALTFQLRRLEAMRDVGDRLMAGPRLGRDVFARGDPEGFEIVRRPVYDCSMFELLKAYGDNRGRSTAEPLRIAPPYLFNMGDMLKRLRGVMGDIVDWRTLLSFLPEDSGEGMLLRSAVASSFAASLELARSGDIELRQNNRFGPIYIRRAPARSGSEAE